MRLFFLALGLLGERGEFFYSKILFLGPLTDFCAFIDNFGEFIDFLNSLPVTLFQFLDDFERTVLFTKNSEELLSVGAFFNFHEVICPSCALNVK